MEEEEENTKTNESLISIICRCCFGSTKKDIEIVSDDKETDRETILKNSKMQFEDDDSLFPINMIRPEEKNNFKFTKDGLIEFIKNLQNLVFSVICEENKVKISKRNFTDINENLPLYRFEITRNKLYFTNVPTILQMVDAIRNPNSRKKWDNNIKEYKIVSTIKIDSLKIDSEVIRTLTNKQLSVIAEKEFYEKRVGIYDDNVYYLFSSSIPDENFPKYSNFERGKNYMSIMVIKEDENNFYFDCFNQIYANIDIPQEFIESNLFNKVNTFFDNYFEYLNKISQRPVTLSQNIKS